MGSTLCLWSLQTSRQPPPKLIFHHPSSALTMNLTVNQIFLPQVLWGLSVCQVWSKKAEGREHWPRERKFQSAAEEGPPPPSPPLGQHSVRLYMNLRAPALPCSWPQHHLAPKLLPRVSWKPFFAFFFFFFALLLGLTHSRLCPFLGQPWMTTIFPRIKNPLVKPSCHTGWAWEEHLGDRHLACRPTSLTDGALWALALLPATIPGVGLLVPAPAKSLLMPGESQQMSLSQIPVFRNVGRPDPINWLK